jgi:hypothetical protein
MTLFDDMIDSLVSGLTVEASPIWEPNPDNDDGTPNPQRLAYESDADILGYGGSGGSGKTDLLLGLAATNHQNSIIFRRVFKNLRGMVKRSREIFNPEEAPRGKDSYNESKHRWLLSNGRSLEFESMQYEKDKENFRGVPHDFYGFDEATEFTRSQIEFVMGWMRSTNPGQRCRAVLTFNPPTDESGTWVIDFFLPWIAYLFPNEFTHPNPAKPGELRWFATIDGAEKEFMTGDEIIHDGEVIRPLSRTFIPGRLSDNPHLESTGYRSVLQSLPEPLRSQVLHGDFSAKANADPWQVIPTEWVKLAQKRWLEREVPEMPLSGVGVDVARGGLDNLVISRRHGTYFDELISIPGIAVEDGPAVTGFLFQHLDKYDHIGYINIDVINVGTSAYDSTKSVYTGITNPINVSEKSYYKVKAKGDETKTLFTMRNLRAEMYWRLREALDPIHGDNIALPNDNELVADLCAARYKVLAGGVIQIEPKEQIKKRIHRSPDKGEALMLANLNRTPIQPGGESIEMSMDIYKSKRNRNEQRNREKDLRKRKTTRNRG